MPPKPSEQAIQIGQSLRKWRFIEHLSRADLGRAIGEKEERLATYEAGRVPLSLEVFKKLWLAYRLNPQYLAEQVGPEELSRSAFKGIDALISEGIPRARFSDFYREQLAPVFNSPEGKAETAREWVSQHFASMMLGLCRDRVISSEQIPSLQRAIKEIERIVGSGGFELAKPELATVSIKRHISNMPKGSSRVESLLSRLRVATSAHGAKTKLAKTLGVSRTQISDWLSLKGGKTPSAEHALALLHWLTDPDAFTKKTPAVVETQPARKAKTSRTRNAKKGIGPPRK